MKRSEYIHRAYGRSNELATIEHTLNGYRLFDERGSGAAGAIGSANELATTLGLMDGTPRTGRPSPPDWH